MISPTEYEFIDLWSRKKWGGVEPLNWKESNKIIEEPKDCSYVFIENAGDKLGILCQGTDIAEIYEGLTEVYGKGITIVYRESITKTQLQRMKKVNDG